MSTPQTRTKLIVRYIIVLSIGFACNLLLAVQLYGVNVQLAKNEYAIATMKKQNQELSIVVANNRSSETVLKRAHDLGFTVPLEPLYVLAGTVAQK